MHCSLRRALFAGAALVLAAAGAALGQIMAFSTDVNDDRDPRAFLDEVLSKKEYLPEEDKAALRKMLAEQLSDETALVPYESMSAGRRVRLNGLLSGMVGQFGDDPVYMTPLQREYNRRAFAPALKVFFNIPVFAPTDSPEVRSQVETMARTLAAAAERKYPEIAGTKAAAMAEQKLIEGFLQQAGNDSAPALKYPLPPGDFARVLQEIEAAYAALEPRRQPPGPSEEFWNSLSEEAKQQQLEMQERQKAFWLGVEFQRVSQAYESASVKAAMEGRYSDLDLAGLQERLQKLTDPREREELNDLAQRAGLEMRDLQRKYTEQQQEKWRRQSEEQRFKMFFGDPMERDTERIVADLALEADSPAEAETVVEPEPAALEVVASEREPAGTIDSGEKGRAKRWVSAAVLLLIGGAGVAFAIIRKRKAAAALLLAAVLASGFDAYAQAAGAEQAAPPEPGAYLEQLLAGRDNILAEDKDALRRILADRLADSTALVPYEAMSPGRRAALNELIFQNIRQFPSESAFITPLQREKSIKGLSIELLCLVNAPLFAPTGSPEVARQTKALADAIGAAAARAHRETAGTTVPRLAAQEIVRRLEEAAADDMAPELKYPLAEDVLAALLRDIEAGKFDPEFPPILGADAWYLTDDAERTESVNENAETISKAVVNQFRGVVEKYREASSEAALAGPYSDIDLESAPAWLDPREYEEFDDLQKRAMAERKELQEQMRSEREAQAREKALDRERRARFETGLARDERSIVEELAAAPGAGPVESAGQDAPASVESTAAPAPAVEAEDVNVSVDANVSHEGADAAQRKLALKAIAAVSTIALIFIGIMIARTRRRRG